MALEEKGVDLILTGEPHLKRTPTHNPGYDLFEAGEDGQPVRWIGVKAMTGDLYDRPVGVSRTQFQCAQQHGEAYWLYVVENAGDENRARIVRIQDPAGKACTFTFDHGWRAVAELVGGGASLVEEEESS
jgi:Protein NO VEIN, C-terminal